MCSCAATHALCCGSVLVPDAMTCTLTARCSKHHVLFTDGEEALLDLEAEDLEFIECPSEAASVTAAARAASKPAPLAAIVAAERDKGQRLCVLWQDTGVWWPGQITHIVETG